MTTTEKKYTAVHEKLEELRELAPVHVECNGKVSPEYEKMCNLIKQWKSCTDPASVDVFNHDLRDIICDVKKRCQAEYVLRHMQAIKDRSEEDAEWMTMLNIYEQTILDLRSLLSSHQPK